MLVFINNVRLIYILIKVDKKKIKPLTLYFIIIVSVQKMGRRLPCLGNIDKLEFKGFEASLFILFILPI